MATLTATQEYVDFNPLDFEEYRIRALGNGALGGKAKGLIFAKEVLKASKDVQKDLVQIPESWFLTTELFGEFIHKNGFTNERLHEIGYSRLEEEFQKGKFSESALEDLKQILSRTDFPLAVRSSSKLEDSLRYSFAGKYLTTFIPNRGSLDTRLEQLVRAVKQVYASTFGPNPVAYRRKRGVTGEEMGIIVQRLIGKDHNGLFYPETAGVGFSKNYRRWTERIKAEDGVVRIVFGLGTKSTGRGYARMYSLTNPNLRPEGNNLRDIAKYSQETFDFLNLKTGELETHNINSRLPMLKQHPKVRQIAQVYSAFENDMKDITVIPEEIPPDEKVVFTFEYFCRYHRCFFDLISCLFNLLEKRMGVPVDIEFTYDLEDRAFSLLQARPLSSYEEYRRVQIPEDIPPEKIILKGDRMLTNGVKKGISHLVYVNDDVYLAAPDKASVAREVGRVNNELEGRHYILVGPGRWGSSNKYLGVPVTYSEISSCGVLVELGIQKKDFVPELSYGTHFFSDLDVDGVLYMPVFDSIETNIINKEWFEQHEFIPTRNDAVRIYHGRFNVYFDGENMQGVVVGD